MAGRMPELNQAQHDEIAARIANGEGRNHIAREMGVSTWSVSKSAKAQNLVFDNAVSAATLSGAMAHAKQVRLQMQLDALEHAQAELNRLVEPSTVFNFGGPTNEYREHELDRPVPADALRIAQAHSLLVKAALDLAKIDSETGVDAVVSMLGGIAQRLGVGVPAEQDPDGPPVE